MRNSVIVLFFLIAVELLSVDSSQAADVSCFGCHDAVQFSGKVVHKPVADARCDVCHNPHVARYKGLLRNRQDVLCYSCHRRQEKAFSQGIVHDPVARGKCSSCHAPHVGSRKGLIRDDPAADCFACHKKLPEKYKVTHKPYAEGRCMSCHRPHQADNLQLLADESDHLCLSCHEDSGLEEGHSGFPGKLKNCLSCHNPHGSERAGLIRNVVHQPFKDGCGSCHDGSVGLGMENCLKCHPDVRKQMLAPHSHLSQTNGNSCLNCHSPHAGDDENLLKGPERLLCASCHGQTMAGYRQSRFRHSDIQDCSGCHEVHGSRNPAMIKGDGNDVCIQCHENQGKFTHPVGPGVLDRFTGQMVTCVSCHNPMGTEFEYHLVREGKKALCIVCHRAY